MKPTAVAIALCFAAFVGCAVSVHAAELRFAGVLGNTGESADTLVAFSERQASGIGPVIDDEQTLWERAGAGRLNRYALDGRLLASFAIPTSTSHSDQMTRADDRLVLLLGKTAYWLSLTSQPDSKPVPIDGNVDRMSSNTKDGQVVIVDGDQLFWLDVTSAKRTLIRKIAFRVAELHIGSDDTLYVFGDGNVYAWQNGEPVEGFPKPFHAERPQKIGNWWYGHAWHGTIKRFNEQFEPEPGVVAGGASGSFIGYLPESSDLNNGRGMVQINDGLCAVSGFGGVVQLLKWNDNDTRFELVRRLGALANLQGVALDAEGNIWTPRGAWRWTDSPEAPHTLGDVEPQTIAQPVVLDGKNLCLLKQHYSYVQLARGRLIDANGWAHFATSAVDDFKFDKSVTGAAAFANAKGHRRLVVVREDGNGVELGISPDGALVGKPVSTQLPGLKNCTSLAYFDGQLLAADGGTLVVFDRTENDQWKESARLNPFGEQIFIHSDGKRLAVSDTQHHVVHLFDSLKIRVATFGTFDAPGSTIRQLNAPAHVAVQGNRVVVYDRGNQRLARLELTDSAVAAGHQAKRWSGQTAAPPAQFTDADFQELGRPGGIAFAVAVDESQQGLSISVRTEVTPVPTIRLGVAGGNRAFILTNDNAHISACGFDFYLPGYDWSNLRLAAALAWPKNTDRHERLAHLDHRAIHRPFSENTADWAPFDLANYRQLVAERKQQIWIEFQQPVDGKATIVIEGQDGTRIRNLVSGRSFTAGNHRVRWDGLDEKGRLVSPGNYHWRGITHPGIEPHYLMNFANGGEETIRPWGPNHGVLHDATTNGQLVFFAAPVTEGGWALLSLDADGKLVQGYEHQQGFGIGHNAIAADAQYLYCAQDGFGWGGTRGIDFGSDAWTSSWKLTVARYDIETGKVVEFPGRQRAFEADTMDVGPGSAHKDLRQYNLAGLALLDGKLYVGSRRQNAVLVFDAETGKQLHAIPVQCPRHLAATPSDVLAATDRGVVRLRDRKLLIEAREMELSGITVAPSGDILVSDRKSHQIYCYGPSGRRLATIGTPGGPYAGVYDRTRMVNPAGITFGPDGKLWVTEERWNPKRILAWDLTKSEVVYEKFGMPHYGGSGSGFDTENHRRWIGLGCLWDVDFETHQARPTHVLAQEEGHFRYYHPDSYSFFYEKGRTFLATRGKIALISELFEDGTIRDLAAVSNTEQFSYGCNWKPPQSYIDAFYELWPELREKEWPGGKGNQGKPYAQRQQTGVLWVDRNGDGKPQKEEFDFGPKGYEFGGGAWGHRQMSLTFYMPAVVDGQTRVVAIAPKGFLPNGVPNYPTLAEAIAEGTTVDLQPGYARNNVATGRDRFGRFLFNSDPEMNAYGPDGKHLWSYPNQWSNVHGSHRAPLPETGVMQGTLGILGIAPFDDRADVFMLNGNHGRCFLLTSDGLYLDEMFRDVRVSYLNDAYRLGGEIFGGTFDRADGKYYTQIGHGPYRIYEVTGIAEAKRIDGKVTVSESQVNTAEQQNLRRLAESKAEHKITISTLSEPAKIDGNLNDWPKQPTLTWDQNGKFRVSLHTGFDDENLYLGYQVQDASPWINNGRDWTTLFATGDTVDLQIGTNPKADPNRNQPVVGDKRLMIAPYEGKPIAVLFEHRKPGGKNPIEFTSPWRGEKVDDVRQLAETEVAVKTAGSSYIVEARIPLSELGLRVEPGQPYRADFGVTFGDPEGRETQLRCYWANPATMLVDDIPGEIMLHPKLWGEIAVE